MKWIPLIERVPAFTPQGGDPPVLVYSPLMAEDKDFPGHACFVSNPEFVANGNATKHYGATHWCEIPAYPVQQDPTTAGKDPE